MLKRTYKTSNIEMIVFKSRYLFTENNKESGNFRCISFISQK